MAKNSFNAVIIGAGKIAWSLAAVLPGAGIKIVSVISRTKKSAKALADKYDVQYYSSRLKDIPSNANLFLITVPDTQIDKAAISLSLIRRSFNECLFIHFSGVESIEPLTPLAEKDGLTGSIHIMQTFASKDVVPVKGCYAAIEAKEIKAEKILYKMARDLKLKPFSISSDKKALYHLSGVLAANFLIGNFYAAENLSGNSFMQGELLGGITSKALANTISKGAVKSLSGPVERGDIETIKKHLNALENISNKKGVKNIRLSYISQSLVLLDLVKTKNGKLSPSHTKIKKLLKSELLKQL